MRVRRVGLLAALALAALAGCAGVPKPVPVPGALLAGRPRVLMLPLANLSGRNEQGDLVSRVFYAAFARTERCELVDYGEAERLVQELRMRDPGSPNAAQVRALGDSTGARYLLAGTVLEAGVVHAPEGDVPSIGVALRLIATDGGRPVWADSRFRTGQDKETIFGWGRETSLNRLTERLAAEMFAAFERSGAAPESTRRAKP